MTIERYDGAYGKRTIRRMFVVIVALLVVGVLLIPTVFAAARVTAVGYSVLGLWVAVLVIGTVWASRVETRYRCPQCGAYLPPEKPDVATNYQHRFHCAACDVLWTTDVHTGD